MLSYMLTAAFYSLEEYEEKGIPKEIFTDTMKCFSRFTQEHYESYGYYGFDRGFWTGRQLSFQLFRLGELEFEKTIEENQKIIAVHIPSDAILTEENCKKSLRMADDFFREDDVEEDCTEYLTWIFKRNDLDLKDLPENTSLQKNAKKYLLNGGKIGEGKGYLKHI